mgnify:CR=1 FL=1
MRERGLSPRAIIARIITIIIFAILALRGDITPDNVMIVVSTVVAFYFGTQHEKKQSDGDGESDV